MAKELELPLEVVDHVMNNYELAGSGQTIFRDDNLMVVTLVDKSTKHNYLATMYDSGIIKVGKSQDSHPNISIVDETYIKLFALISVAKQYNLPKEYIEACKMDIDLSLIS